MIKYQMMHGLQEPRQLIIWSLLVVQVVVNHVVEQLVVEELVVIELLVMDQVHYKDQIKN
tara:strand:+ start:842 stop:1021 length:180 start_codon:yes stop_codon:yes gene_type:complete